MSCPGLPAAADRPRSLLSLQRPRVTFQHWLTGISGCCTAQLPLDTPALANRPGLPRLSVRPIPGPGAWLGLRACPKTREAARPHCVCLIHPGVRQGKWAGHRCLPPSGTPHPKTVVGSRGTAVVGAQPLCVGRQARQETAGWVETGARTVASHQTMRLLPVCRQSWKSRETPWSRGRRWSSWMICWRLAVRVFPPPTPRKEGLVGAGGMLLGLEEGASQGSGQQTRRHCPASSELRDSARATGSLVTIPPPSPPAQEPCGQPVSC